jgi:hypothetical protein
VYDHAALMNTRILRASGRCLLLGCTAAESLSCSAVLGIEDTTLQEQQQSVDPAQDWRCVGGARELPSTDQLTISINTIEFLSASATQAVPGVEVRVCGRYDPSCSAAPQPVATTDDQGLAATVVSVDKSVKGFSGYLQFSKQGYTTLKWLFSQPPVKDTSLTVNMITTAGFAAMTASNGAPADASKGHLTCTIFSCGKEAGGAPVFAANAVVTVSPRNAEAMGFYTGSNLGLENETSLKHTTATGRFALFNLNPGSVSVTVAAAADPGRTVSQEQAAPIVAGEITTIDMYPNQSAP